MDIYCISDSHFGHDNMVKWALRPKDFNERIWKGLQSLPDDCILIHLGDISMGSEALAHMKLQEFKFKKWLVRGNHDNRTITWYINNGWDFVADQIMIKTHGKNIILSHHPLPKVEGIHMNIHGHLHGSKSHPRPDFYDEDYHKEITPEVIGYNPAKL
jgi:calcineurin-like phosphoesterase family protein